MNNLAALYAGSVAGTPSSATVVDRIVSGLTHCTTGEPLGTTPTSMFYDITSCTHDINFEDP
jgi:hypothetical protein